MSAALPSSVELPWCIVGAGPAGLMAADVLSAAGAAPVWVFDAMPTAGRKLLMAGKSGLNLTHSEDFSLFCQRFGSASAALRPALEAFPPQAVRDWAAALGSETFVGSSGRVFPHSMKAAPLLRSWLRQLRGRGVRFHMRHRWQGWDAEGALSFHPAEAPPLTVRARAVILALGGASWPQLGSDGQWTALLRPLGVPLAEFRAANCGFDVAWSPYLRETFAGTPLKPLAISVKGGPWRQGECVLSQHGVEGSLIYALSAEIRDALAQGHDPQVRLDLVPQLTASALSQRLSRPRGSQSFSTYLKKTLRLEPVKIALLREGLSAAAFAACQSTPSALVTALKSLPLAVLRPRPLAEAISTAGGICFAGENAEGGGLGAGGALFLPPPLPPTYACGEMMDWEAPTGGYLLTACLATGAAAAREAWRENR